MQRDCGDLQEASPPKRRCEAEQESHKWSDIATGMATQATRTNMPPSLEHLTRVCLIYRVSKTGRCSVHHQADVIHACRGTNLCSPPPLEAKRFMGTALLPTGS
jgi:hypothetical protein